MDAATSTTAAVDAAAAAGSVAPGAGSVLGMFASLVLVIGLIFALAWLARRMQAMRRGPAGMQVLAAVPVGAKERVVMVKLGEEHFLLGVASGSVSLLHRYEHAPPSLGGSTGAAPPDWNAFAAKLREKLGKQA